MGRKSTVATQQVSYHKLFVNKSIGCSASVPLKITSFLPSFDVNMDGIRSGSVMSKVTIHFSSVQVQKQLSEISDQTEVPIPDDTLEASMSDLEDLFDEGQDEIDLNVLTNIAIDVLERFVSRDPMVYLNEFYQQKLKVNPKGFFKEEPPQNIAGRSFFNFSFHCPITKNVYFSSLPIPMFQERKENKLVELTKKCFGEYIVQKHQVVFSGKRFAKRAVAVAVLEAHSMLGADMKDQKLFLPISPEDIRGDSIDKSDTKKVESESAPTSAFLPASERKFPSWVHECHKIGVRHDSLSILYKEKVGNRSFRIGEPTRLCCIITIHEPIELKVFGYPSSTKKDALGNAVALLVEEVGRQTGNTSYTAELSTPRQVQTEKEGILTCNPSTANYVSYLSSWTTSPLPIVSKTTQDIESGSVLYLYRLDFFDCDGQNFVTARSGVLKPTPLGVIFCAEIPVLANGYIEAQFAMKQKGPGQQANALVRLSKGIQLSGGNQPSPLTKDRLQDLIRFNREIQDWKRYGLRSVNELDTSEQILDGRTYMFAPLIENDSLEVDWISLRDISTQQLKPYIEAIDANWNLPLLGKVDLLFFSVLLLLLSWSFLTIGMANRGISVRNTLLREHFHELVVLGYKYIQAGKANDMKSIFAGWYLLLNSFLGSKKGTFAWELYAYFILLVSSIVSYLCYYLLPPTCHYTDYELSNRFLKNRFKFPTGRLFVTRPVPFRSFRITGRSRCRTKPCDDDYRNLCRQKWNYDPNTVTFVGRSLKRDGNLIRHVRMPLLQLYKVSKVSSHDPFNSFKYTNKEYYENVFPEAVMVYPMPKDVLFLLKHESSFMRALEFKMESLEWAFQLNELGKATCYPHSKRPRLPVVTLRGSPRSLPRLVEEACTLSPKERYQRLEFLGDAVLGYFLALNLMARNAELKWDFDELSNLLSVAARNSALYDASLRTGVNRMLRQDTDKWKSAFRSSATISNTTVKTTLEFSLLMGSSSQIEEIRELRDRTLADVAESLLGIAFLDGLHKLDENNSNLTIALLNEFRLPLPKERCKTEESGWPWFRAMGCCMKAGYPFDLDKSWKKQLVSVGTALYTNDEMILELTQGYTKLVEKLVELSGQLSLHEILSVQASKILLLCSIFDESLSDNSDSGSSIMSLSNGSTMNSEETSIPPLERTRPSLSRETEASDDALSIESTFEKGLFRAGLTRDTLALLGASALQLCITHQLFERNPDVQEGGLHVLRAVASTDDCVVYVFIKNGFDVFLFDKKAPAISRFKTEMALSDSIGRQKWDTLGGWILDGGNKEFERRWTLNSDRVPEPKYTGIGGGRLYSHQKGKLPEFITADLAFSFKSIIGALVLCVGVDGMWQCIGPVFEELLLLSFEEVRREYDFSTIVKGK